MACAAALARKGVKRIKIYERAQTLQKVGAAIGLFPNGLAALEAISPTVTEKVHGSEVPISILRVKSSLDGSVISESNTATSTRVAPKFLVWYLLQEYLCDDLPEGVLSLGHVLESFSADRNDSGEMVRVRVSNRSDETVETKTCRVLIGADGIKSIVRNQLFGERELMYHGKMMFRGVMDLDQIETGICPPTGESVGYQGDEKGKLFAFRETAKGILTVTAMSMFETPDLIEEKIARKERLKKLFSTYPSDVEHIIDRLPPSALIENAVHDIEVEEKWSEGPVLLIGDAAHAMTPGLGQGANQGLEDACELANVLAPFLLAEKQKQGGNSLRDVSDVLEFFWRSRIERVKEIHAASRAMSASANKSSAKNSVKLRKGDSFQDAVYGWKPSSAQV